jgi:hypothetical protein
MPACEAGIQLAQIFLENCGEKCIDRLGTEEAADRITQITASYTAMVEHAGECEDCTET